LYNYTTNDYRCTFLGCPDNDSDGFNATWCGGTDCNDTNPNIHPRATEICTNNIDDDCDNLTDCADYDCYQCTNCSTGKCFDGVCRLDNDGDGYVQVPAGYMMYYGCMDCDDTNANIHPGVAEVCNNNKDDDCDLDKDCDDDECIGKTGPNGGECCRRNGVTGVGLCYSFYGYSDTCDQCETCGSDKECENLPDYTDDCDGSWDENGKCPLCVNGVCTQDYSGTYYERLSGSTRRGDNFCVDPSEYGWCYQLNARFNSTPSMPLVNGNYTVELKRDLNYVSVVVLSNSSWFHGYVDVYSSCATVWVDGYGSRLNPVSLWGQNQTALVNIGVDLSASNVTSCRISLSLTRDCYYGMTYTLDYATINATLPALTENNYNLSITPAVWVVNLTNTSNSNSICTDTKKTFTITNTGTEVVADINAELTEGMQSYYLIDNPIDNFRLYPNQSVNFTLYLFIDSNTASSSSNLLVTFVNTRNVTVQINYTTISGTWAEKPNVSSYNWSVILTGRDKITYGFYGNYWYPSNGYSLIQLRVPRAYNLSELENASLAYNTRSDNYAYSWWGYSYWYWPYYLYFPCAGSFECTFDSSSVQTDIYLNNHWAIAACRALDGGYDYEIPNNYSTSNKTVSWWWYYGITYPYSWISNAYFFLANKTVTDYINYTNKVTTAISVYQPIKGTSEIAVGLRLRSFDKVAYCSGLACNVTQQNETTCSDGTDNDCDGFTDCWDLDCCALDNSTGCLGTFYCKPAENCSNGLDDDNDGMTDCNDTADCCALPVCSSVGVCVGYKVYDYLNTTLTNLTTLLDGNALPSVPTGYPRKTNLRGTHRFEIVNATGYRFIKWDHYFDADFYLNRTYLTKGSTWLAASGFQGNATFYVPYGKGCDYLIECNGTAGCSSGGSQVNPARMTPDPPFSCIVENVTGTSVENRPILLLRPGFNMISLPVLPGNLSVLSALSSLQFGIDYDAVYRYNTTEQFEVFRNVSWLNQFTELELGKGYYIYMLRAKNLTITGTPLTQQQTVNLTGTNKWNLVGWSSLSTKNIASSVSGLNLDTDFSAIELYNASSGTFIGYYDTDEAYNTLHEFSPYNGYWFYVLRNATWGYET